MHLYQYGLVMHDPNEDDDGADTAQHLPPPTLLISEILADVDRQLVDSLVEASQHLPSPTLPISEILADVDRQLVDSPVEASQHLPPPTLPISEILADVARQLVDYPVETASATYEAGGAITNADKEAIARMDSHVRSILAGSSSRLFVLNNALGHNLPPTPLTESSINDEIAEICAYYYDDSEDDDEDEAETELKWLFNTTTSHVNADHASPTDPPHYTQPYVTTSTPRSDLGIRFEAIPRAMEGSNTTPYEPPGNRETLTGSSSTAPTLPTLHPRASWMIDDGDERTEAQADADWHRANDQLSTTPATATTPIYSSSSSVPTPITPTPTPIMPTVKDKKERAHKRVLLPLEK